MSKIGDELHESLAYAMGQSLGAMESVAVNALQERGGAGLGEITGIIGLACACDVVRQHIDAWLRDLSDRLEDPAGRAKLRGLISDAKANYPSDVIEELIRRSGGVRIRRD